MMEWVKKLRERKKGYQKKAEEIRSLRYFMIVSWMNADPKLARSVKATLDIYGVEA